MGKSLLMWSDDAESASWQRNSSHGNDGMGRQCAIDGRRMHQSVCGACTAESCTTRASSAQCCSLQVIPVSPFSLLTGASQEASRWYNSLLVGCAAAGCRSQCGYPA